MNISLRIDEETVKRLDKAAEALDRPRSWVATEAIEQFLSYHEWFTASVEKAVQLAESGGPFLAHEDVVAQSLARSKGRAK